jgi:hypothetical protein
MMGSEYQMILRSAHSQLLHRNGRGPATAEVVSYGRSTTIGSTAVTPSYSCRDRCGAEDAHPVPRAALLATFESDY